MTLHLGNQGFFVLGIRLVLFSLVLLLSLLMPKACLKHQELWKRHVAAHPWHTVARVMLTICVTIYSSLHSLHQRFTCLHFYKANVSKASVSFFLWPKLPFLLHSSFLPCRSPDSVSHQPPNQGFLRWNVHLISQWWILYFRRADTPRKGSGSYLRTIVTTKRSSGGIIQDRAHFPDHCEEFCTLH